MKQKITIKTIAQQAGVDPATVSRALNPATASLISEKVRQKIRMICDEFGYRPALSGRTVATGKTFKIGLILGRMAKDFSAHNFARIICSLSAELQKHDYALTILRANLKKNMDEQVCNFLMSGIADGYITGPSMLGSNVFSLLQKLNTPFRIICDRHNLIPSVHHVIRDNSKALQTVWRSIPAPDTGKTLFFSHDIPSNNVPLADIKEAAQQIFKCDIPVKTLLYRRDTTFNAMEYRDAFKTAMANIDFIKKFKVIWCESDFTAAALLDVLENSGITVGKDILLVGSGDLENYNEDCARPVISTINMNEELIGKALADSLISEINGKTPTDITIESKFIPRKTFPINNEVKI